MNDPIKSDTPALEPPLPPGTGGAAASTITSSSGLLDTILGRRPASSGDADAPLVDVATRRARIGQLGVPIMALLLFLVFSLTASDFLTGANLKTILGDAALPTLVAVGLTICLAMGQFDLSLNGVAGLATVLVAQLVAKQGVATAPAILAGLGVGVFAGALNGLFVGYVGVAALIVTIALNSVLNGGQYIVSGSQQ